MFGFPTKYVGSRLICVVISARCLQVLAKKVPSVQLSEFVFILLDGLIDPDPQSSSGTCVVLNSLMRQRGSELSSEVSVHVPLVSTACMEFMLSHLVNSALVGLLTRAFACLFCAHASLPTV